MKTTAQKIIRIIFITVVVIPLTLFAITGVLMVFYNLISELSKY